MQQNKGGKLEGRDDERQTLKWSFARGDFLFSTFDVGRSMFAASWGSRLEDQGGWEMFGGFFEGDEGVAVGVGSTVDQTICEAGLGGGEIRDGKDGESMAGKGDARGFDESGEHFEGFALGQQIEGLQGIVGFRERQVGDVNGGTGEQPLFEESCRPDVLKRRFLHQETHDHGGIELVCFRGLGHLREILSFSAAACPQPREMASLIPSGS